MTTPTLDLDGLKALRAQATKGPWAFESVGEKSNEYVIGLATKEDGTAIEGQISSDADFVDDVVGRTGLMSDLDCFADAAYIVALVNAAEAMIAAAEERDALRAQAKALPERYHKGYPRLPGGKASLNEPMVDAEWLKGVVALIAAAKDEGRLGAGETR